MIAYLTRGFQGHSRSR